MSLLNVRLQWLLPRVECIAALMACIAMDKASSMYSWHWPYLEVVPHVVISLGHFLLFNALFCTRHSIRLRIFGCSAHISDVTLL
jgi:hypothetical protein